MTVFSDACTIAQNQRRTFVDWHDFWAESLVMKPSEHLLYMGGMDTVFDACCHRQICAREIDPYPRLSVIAPYLRAISRGIEERPRIEEWGLLLRHPPYFYDGALSSDDLCYVDIDRAYWNFYTRTTLDVSYDGTGPPVRGHIEFQDTEELGEDKLVRNALLGMLRRRFRRGLDHGLAFREDVHAKKRRPSLWALVMDALELVMWTARDQGAVYVHTDGAIFSSHEQALSWMNVSRETFKIPTTLRARGAGFVRGIGNFQIGEHTTKRPEYEGARLDSMCPTPEPVKTLLTEWLYYATIPI